jgi:hypothetical protein
MTYVSFHADQGGYVIDDHRLSPIGCMLNAIRNIFLCRYGTFSVGVFKNIQNPTKIAT